MSDAKITIKFDKGAIKAMEKACNDALVETAFALQDEIREAGVIPRMDNHLAGDKFKVNASEANQGVVYLEHDGPYARRLYYHPEYHFHREPWVDKYGNQHLGNPNAMANWFSWWEEGGRYQGRPAEIYTAILKRKGL